MSSSWGMFKLKREKHGRKMVSETFHGISLLLRISRNRKFTTRKCLYENIGRLFLISHKVNESQFTKAPVGRLDCVDKQSENTEINCLFSFSTFL